MMIILFLATRKIIHIGLFMRQAKKIKAIWVNLNKTVSNKKNNSIK